MLECSEIMLGPQHVIDTSFITLGALRRLLSAPPQLITLTDLADWVRCPRLWPLHRYEEEETGYDLKSFPL